MERVRTGSVWAVLLGYSAIVVVPLYIMFVSSMKTTQEIFTAPLALPSNLSLDNFVEAWERAKFSTYFINSVIVTVASVALTLLVSVPASYVMGRYRMRWLGLVLVFFLLGLMLPIRLGVVRLFLLLRDLQQLDTLTGIIAIYVGVRIPFAVFVIANFMRTIPREMEEAARIDGASEVRILWHVIVPLVAPAIAIVGIFTAIAVWNDFFFPLIFLFSDENKTIPLGLATFVGQYSTNWGALFAGLTISALPLMIVYLLMSRRVRAGISTGGVR